MRRVYSRSMPPPAALRFLAEFLHHPFSTGAVAPSSRALGDVMVRECCIAAARSVAELGSGTGVFTRRIALALRPEAELTVLELNPIFARATREACPVACVHEDSAANLRAYAARVPGGAFDAILCGMPWASFGEDLQAEMLGAIADSLAPGGTFTTFTYVHTPLFSSARRFRRLLGEHFASVRRTRVVWGNLPPAYAYVAQGPLTIEGRPRSGTP